MRPRPIDSNRRWTNDRWPQARARPARRSKLAGVKRLAPLALLVVLAGLCAPPPSALATPSAAAATPYKRAALQLNSDLLSWGHVIGYTIETAENRGDDELRWQFLLFGQGVRSVRRDLRRVRPPQHLRRLTPHSSPRWARWCRTSSRSRTPRETAIPNSPAAQQRRLSATPRYCAASGKHGCGPSGSCRTRAPRYITAATRPPRTRASAGDLSAG
jgi:hypothetical protein